MYEPLPRQCNLGVISVKSMFIRPWQAVQVCDSSAGSGGSRKSGLALTVARGWRKLVGEATDEVRWLPTGCLQLLDTLQRVSGWCFAGNCAHRLRADHGQRQPSSTSCARRCLRLHCQATDCRPASAAGSGGRLLAPPDGLLGPYHLFYGCSSAIPAHRPDPATP